LQDGAQFYHPIAKPDTNCARRARFVYKKVMLTTYESQKLDTNCARFVY
jgi:hypothetical protein